MCKTVYFIRHAEATSNKAARGLALGSPERTAVYRDIQWFDSRLSDLGHEQCGALLESTKHLAPDLVVVSPLTRALQTWRGGVGPRPGVPVLALECIRERCGLNPCDSRRPRAEVAAEFPEVDFSRVPDGPDPKLCNSLGGGMSHRETNEEMDERIQAFLGWLREQTAQRVAVVSHSSFLERMFQAHLGWDPSHGGAWLDNAELRAVVLALGP